MARWRIRRSTAWKILLACAAVVVYTIRQYYHFGWKALLLVGSHGYEDPNLPMIAYAFVAPLIGISMIFILLFAPRVPRKMDSDPVIDAEHTDEP